MDHCKTLVFIILNVLGLNMNHYKTQKKTWPVMKYWIMQYLRTFGVFMARVLGTEDQPDKNTQRFA